MIVFEKLEQLKKIITQLVVCWAIIVLNTTISALNTIKHLMLIQNQYNKLIFLEIQVDQQVQQFFSLLKKQKKLF